MGQLVEGHAPPPVRRERRDSAPKEGSQWRSSENMIIAIIPSQKVGIDIPKIAVVVTATSLLEYCRLAEKTPRGIPIASERRSAGICSSNVVPTHGRIFDATVPE